MAAAASQPNIKRTNRLLSRKFGQYLLPTMITYAAVSLNEFADSMLVSNLLGSRAMAIVGLGMPLMLAMAGVYALLGSGGATVYGISIGRRDHETAGRSLTAALCIALITGLLFLVFGYVFFEPLSGALCSDATLKPELNTYLRVLLLSSPFLIVILSFVSFLPSAGYPGIATAVNVIANVVNIIMDYVYIRVFGMGVEGAAWATLTGYLCATVVVVALLCLKKIKLHVSRHLLASFHTFQEICKLGGPDAMTQIGFALQFAACNALAIAFAGTGAVVAYSLCIQTNSVVSIFIGALLGSSMPLLAVLHGQRDFRGEEGILKTAMIGQLIVAAVSLLTFELFAPQIAALYSITDAPQLALAVRSLHIFSLYYIPRCAIIIYFRYLKVIGLSRYATVISALDGFAAIVPVAWLMTQWLGIDGLWIAYPLTSYALLLGMLLCNAVYRAQSKGKLRGALLYEYDEESKPILDVTITRDAADIAGISETLQQVCEEHGLPKKEAVLAALAVEEMGVYAAGKKRQQDYMDLLVRLNRGNVEIDFRSLGAAYNPMNDDEGDMVENIRVLRSIAASIETEYILGMNSTRIVIKGKEKSE